jgi:glycerol-3-phosphate O-acyltransferase/dihydroxyacetone phosphate acyltransferase
VPFISWWSIHDVIGSALYGFLIFALASIPSFVLNAPVGFLARYVAHGEQKKALEGSKVKVAARDVLLSKKIQFSIVAVPVLWLVYLLTAILFTDWYWSSIFLLLLSFPLFSFFGVRSVEAGIIELKTVRPLFYRLLPSHKKTQDELPKKRLQLQKEIRDFVRKHKTQLGKLAEPAKLDWHEYMHSIAVKEAEAALAAKALANGSTPKSNGGSNTDGGSSEEDEAIVSVTVRSPPTTITKDHDLSILKKSDKSVIDLAGMERSMSCPPGFQEVLQKQLELERQKSASSASQ